MDLVASELAGGFVSFVSMFVIAFDVGDLLAKGGKDALVSHRSKVDTRH
jgi:hypothetical protein